MAIRRVKMDVMCFCLDAGVRGAARISSIAMASWAIGRCQPSVVGGMLEVEGVTFVGDGTSKELIEDVIRPFFVCKAM